MREVRLSVPVTDQDGGVGYNFALKKPGRTLWEVRQAVPGPDWCPVYFFLDYFWAGNTVFFPWIKNCIITAIYVCTV